MKALERKKRVWPPSEAEAVTEYGEVRWRCGAMGMAGQLGFAEVCESRH
jgi:hypothetical protein